ncbi:uncharacterized protein LOC117118004 isoform X2 [Anneissia japonica]|uniref:uncharacterized protein LOC117118004 isoform X2 n=1 Tax=Anneissia japonica TaxID=1529436 RepID=UPI0014257680|nr:uncharacterized protein LOC117118004 isoform X2 [Anneissia japonica]
MTTNRLVRSVGPKLLPFLISSFVYFALQPQKWEPSPYRIFFKCLPIILINWIMDISTYMGLSWNAETGSCGDTPPDCVTNLFEYKYCTSLAMSKVIW